MIRRGGVRAAENPLSSQKVIYVAGKRDKVGGSRRGHRQSDQCHEKNEVQCPWEALCIREVKKKQRRDIRKQKVAHENASTTLGQVAVHPGRYCDVLKRNHNPSLTWHIVDGRDETRRETRVNLDKKKIERLRFFLPY
jgi:hypothetical protein